MTGTQSVKIGLLWHSLGSGNLGVGALTLSQMAIVQKLCDEKGLDPFFEIVGWGSELDTMPPPGCNARTTLLSSRELLDWRSDTHKILRGCDLILDIGAGDSFSDIYGRKRFLFLWTTKLLSLLRDSPLILSPQTIGPFYKWSSRLLARHILQRCTQVFPRDRFSMAALREMGIEENVTESIDVAFALPFRQRQQNDRPEKKRIGVNISALLFHGGYQRANQFNLRVDYQKLALRLLSELTTNDNLEVHLIPHVFSDTSEVEDDFRLARSLSERFRTTILPEPFRDAIEAKSYISGLDLLTGSRMHATIAAFSAGVPVLPLSYSRKFTGLYATLGYPFLGDLTRDTDDEIMERVSYALDHIPELQQAVAEGNSIAAGRLKIYEDYLSGILDSLKRQG